MRIALASVIALALLATRAPAQQEPARDDTTGADAGIAGILEAIRLPDAAEILRERGVPVDEIEAAIEGAREERVPPEDMTGVFTETAETVEENGPIANFGAFVQERLRAGLRGRDLAAAIRAEHARRGIGPGNRLESRGRPEGPPGQMGRDRSGRDSMPGMADTTARRGPPGQRGQRGRPDSTPRGQGQGSGGSTNGTRANGGQG